MIDECIYKLQKKIVRNWLYDGKRVDGRGIDEIRPLAAEVNVLPSSWFWIIYKRTNSGFNNRYARPC